MDRLVNFFRKHRNKLLLVIAVFILRIPSYFEPLWYGDENIYRAIGYALRHNLMLYRDIFDHKPPLIYWLTASTSSLLMMKLMLSAAVSASLIMMAAILNKLFRSKLIRYGVIFLFIFFTSLPSFEGNIYNAELLFMPFSLGGMWLILHFLESKPDERNNGLLILAGICFGLATGFKIPAVMEFVAGLGLMLFNQLKLKRILIYISGFFLPLAVITLILLTSGNFNEFLDYGLFYNARYVGDWAEVFQSPLINFLAPWWVRLGILISSLWVIYRSKIDLKLKWTLSWFILVLFGILLSLRPYPHYFLQVLPASCLLAGWLFNREKFNQIAAGLGLIGLVLLIIY